MRIKALIFCTGCLGFLLFPCAGWVADARAQITWYARGQFYEASLEFESPGLWGIDSGNELVDDGTGGDAVAGDGIFSRSIPSTRSAGRYEFKITDRDFVESVPNGFNVNLVLVTSTDNEAVLITLDTNFYSDGWLPETRIIWCDKLAAPETGWFIVGDVSELGAWDPDQTPVEVGLAPDVDGIFKTTVNLDDVGVVEYKWVADRAFGIQEVTSQGFSIRDTQNATLEVSAAADYDFFMNPGNGRLAAGLAGTVPADDVSWSAIKALYSKTR